MPLKVDVDVRVRGSDIVIDLTGSSPEVETGYNVPFEGALLVACYYIVRTLLLDEATIEEFVPQNEGMFRPVSAVAPRAASSIQTFRARASHAWRRSSGCSTA